MGKFTGLFDMFRGGGGSSGGRGVGGGGGYGVA